MKSTNISTVCVTGANGFIASHIVKQLLASGKYKVNGTVRNPSNAATVEHLWSLPGAKDNLTLFPADLMQVGSYDAAIKGCDAVIHTASPVFASTTESDTLTPSTTGSRNVLEAAGRESSTVKRVVLTSSACSVFCNYGNLPLSHVYTEEDWSDEALMKSHEDWYCLGKNGCRARSS